MQPIYLSNVGNLPLYHLGAMAKIYHKYDNKHTIYQERTYPPLSFQNVILGATLGFFEVIWVRNDIDLLISLPKYFSLLEREEKKAQCNQAYWPLPFR